VAKRPLPKHPKAELEEEALRLLRRHFEHHSDAMRFVLDRFTGWDLEAIIEELRQYQD
jgi:hypothetical protein